MRFFQDGLSGLYIMKAFKAVLAEEFESGERRLASRVDPSIRSLMIGKGSAAFEVAAVVFDLPLDQRQQNWPVPSAKVAGGPSRREGVARP